MDRGARLPDRPEPPARRLGLVYDAVLPCGEHVLPQVGQAGGGALPLLARANSPCEREEGVTMTEGVKTTSAEREFAGARTDEPLEKRLARIEDIEAIKKLKARYAYYCDHGYDA